MSLSRISADVLVNQSGSTSSRLIRTQYPNRKLKEFESSQTSQLGNRVFASDVMHVSQQERITAIGDEFGCKDDESSFVAEDYNDTTQSSTGDSIAQPATPQWIDCGDYSADGCVLEDGEKPICSSCPTEQGHAEYHSIHWKSNVIPPSRLTMASAKSPVASNFARAIVKGDWRKRSLDLDGPNVERTLNIEEYSPESAIQVDWPRSPSLPHSQTKKHLKESESLVIFKSEVSLTDIDDSDIYSSDEDGGDENLASTQCNNSLAKPSLQSLKPATWLKQSSRALQREICERLMQDVSIFLNSGYRTRGLSQQESPQSSASTSTSNSLACPPRIQGTSNSRKRPVSNGEHDGSEDENWKNTKKPRKKVGTSSNDHSYELACPYRKHDPVKYNVRQWRTCALTPHKTIARVKQHLYRHHRVFQCQRCKIIFDTDGSLEEHFMNAERCELSSLDMAEGITPSIERLLHSRKKAGSHHTEEDRWMHIYQIIFPGEDVPSPRNLSLSEYKLVQLTTAADFVPVQDHAHGSGSTRDFTSYEEYSRRELPRLIRRRLEAAVREETGPIEERLRAQLLEIVEACQDEMIMQRRAELVTLNMQAYTVTPDTLDSTSQELEHGVTGSLTSESNEPSLKSGHDTHSTASLTYTGKEDSASSSSIPQASSLSNSSSVLLNSHTQSAPLYCADSRPTHNGNRNLSFGYELSSTSLDEAYHGLPDLGCTTWEPLPPESQFSGFDSSTLVTGGLHLGDLDFDIDFTAATI